MKSGNNLSTTSKPVTSVNLVASPVVDSIAEMRRIGQLLDTLTPGMTQEQVERILGPPRSYVESEFQGQPLLIGIYPCSPPELPPVGPGHVGHMMQVIYNASGRVPVFLEIDGPSGEGN